MLPTDYFLFLQIAFFLTITPGTPRVVIVTYAINYGLKRSVITAIGDVSANTLQMILVAFGIGALVSAYPNILNYLRWIGILYLLYIAFDLFKSSNNLDFNQSLSTKSNLSLFRDGFLVAFLSPKAWVFFGAIFPQFLNLKGDFGIQLIFGVDYGHQEIVLSEVISNFKTHVQTRLHEEFEADKDDFQAMAVEFNSAGASSLDVRIFLKCKGKLASRKPFFERKLNSFLVEACNKFGYVIPFNQLTVHHANKND